MINKIQQLDQKEYPEWYKPDAKENHYNALPTGWRGIELPEFVRRYERYCITHTEFRQAVLDGKKKETWMCNIHLFYQYGYEGIALVPVIKDAQYTHYRYFAFGCKHNYEEVSKTGLMELAK